MTDGASPGNAPPLGRWLASATSLLTLGAVLWPIIQNWRRTPIDGFPFSYYPMFTAKRSERARVTFLVGIETDGKRHPLHHRYVGAGGQNQVRRQIYRMVKENRADEVCDRVVAKLARENPRLYRRLATVQAVTCIYRLNDYFGGGSREPLRERVHASVVVHPVPGIAPEQENPVRSIYKGPA